MKLKAIKKILEKRAKGFHYTEIQEEYVNLAEKGEAKAGSKFSKTITETFCKSAASNLLPEVCVQPEPSESPKQNKIKKLLGPGTAIMNEDNSFVCGEGPVSVLSEFEKPMIDLSQNVKRGRGRPRKLKPANSENSQAESGMTNLADFKQSNIIRKGFPASESSDKNLQNSVTNNLQSISNDSKLVLVKRKVLSHYVEPDMLAAKLLIDLSSEKSGGSIETISETELAKRKAEIEAEIKKLLIKKERV